MATQTTAALLANVFETAAARATAASGHIQRLWGHNLFSCKGIALIKDDPQKLLTRNFLYIFYRLTREPRAPRHYVCARSRYGSYCSLRERCLSQCGPCRPLVRCWWLLPRRRLVDGLVAPHWRLIDGLVAPLWSSFKRRRD